MSEIFGNNSYNMEVITENKFCFILDAEDPFNRYILLFFVGIYLI
jgi:hypothetical protein